jgi:hypothetical protein
MSRKSPPNKKSLLGNTSLQVELRAASASASSFVQTGVVFTFLMERSGRIVGGSSKARMPWAAFSGLRVIRPKLAHR